MIFSDFLSALGVAHTQKYSDRRFSTMPFMSWFGVSKLLSEYNIDNQGVTLADKSQINELPTPFITPLKGGEWVIVTQITDCTISYLTQGISEQAFVEKFIADWTGNALLAAARTDSCEPDYSKHRLTEIMTVMRNYALIALLAFIICYLFIYNKLYNKWWAYLLAVFYGIGLAASAGLVMKDLGLKSKALDNVCATLRKGGCETVINTGGTFLYIFHWSQVGLTYFTVSLIAFLAFPTIWPWLALLGTCCLPYTIWSLSYQKWVAHSWCTLCVTVQSTFWIIFALWLPSGWWSNLEWSFAPIVLLACYGIIMLSINVLYPDINLAKKDE